MTEEEILNEINSLPPEAQRQVEAFVAFLLHRYRSPAVNTRDTNADWQSEEVVGMWQDRTEMNDSISWVRGVRESEWVK